MKWSNVVARVRDNARSDLRILIPWLAKDGLTLLAAFFTMVGGIAAAISATEARKATAAAREVPVQLAIYTQRRDAVREYTEAHGKLFSAVTETAGSLPINLDSGEDIPKLTDAQLLQLATVARPMTRIYLEYTTAVNRSRGVWSAETDGLIRHAGADARTLVQCFLIMGEHNFMLPPAAWATKRTQLSQECQGYNAKFRDFDNATQHVIANMQREVPAALREAPEASVANSGIPIITGLYE